MADQNEHAQKVDNYLDTAIDCERKGDLSGANRNFKFAAFYEGKRLGVESAKDYAASCSNPYDI